MRSKNIFEKPLIVAIHTANKTNDIFSNTNLKPDTQIADCTGFMFGYMTP